MYKILYKTFYYDTFSYHLLLPKQKVVNNIDSLFTEKKGIFKSPNLKGNFIEFPDTFFMTKKWGFGYIRNFESEPAIIKGIIKKINDNETVIEIAVRPNSVFLILTIAFLPFCFYNIFKAIVTGNLNITMMGLWTFTFALPVLFFMARSASKNLRKTFERYMNITADVN